MTKTDLYIFLSEGRHIDELFELSSGQKCPIFKARWQPGEEIIYIPDLWLNEIPIDRAIPQEELSEIVSMCYTGDDFISECDGDIALAERLFDYVDWQHPCSALPEVDERKPYCVWVTVAEYASAFVYAESEEAAMSKARDLYDKRRLDYHEEKIIGLRAEEIPEEEFPDDTWRERVERPHH